jgi:hypothetical protein
LSIRIKFSQYELRDRAATILNVPRYKILNVLSTCGGSEYLVLLENFEREKKTIKLNIWQIVDALPIQKNNVSSDIFQCPVELIPCLLRLGLSCFPDLQTLKNAYRKLSKEAHPDAGGSAEEFIELQSSYESILARLKV